MYRDGKVVGGKDLTYGPGIDWAAGQFPVQSDKELWLPIRTGSDDRYNGLLANLTDVADCSLDSAGKIKVRPYGNLTLRMFGDQGDLLNSFDLGAALARPNQETVLTGDSKGKASITVEALAEGIQIVEFSLKGKVLTWNVTGAFEKIKIWGINKIDRSYFEADAERNAKGTYHILDGDDATAYELQVFDANLNPAAEKQVEVK
jgi:hypothetical protein